MSFKRKLAAAFGASLAILVGVGALTFRRTLLEDENQEWVSHTHTVIETLDAVLTDAIVAESSQWSYITTGQQSYLKPYHSAAEGVQENTETLRRLTAD